MCVLREEKLESKPQFHGNSRHELPLGTFQQKLEQNETVKQANLNTYITPFPFPRRVLEEPLQE